MDKNRQIDSIMDIIRGFEGFSSTAYPDIKDIPTVGLGVNLQSPEVPQILESQGLNVDELKAGRQEITPEQADTVAREQLAEKLRYFDAIKNRDFPDSEIEPHEERALLSLGYNSPRLWGPRIRKLLNINDDIGVAKEILLRSNRERSGGLQRRRILEAKIYAGDKWEEVLNSLSPEEHGEIMQILNTIRNPYTKKQLPQEFPDLFQDNRFTKLFNK